MRVLMVGCLVVLLAARMDAAERDIVRDGRGLAEIVVSETPSRSVRLAVQELRDGIEKISGVRLPVVTVPSGDRVRLLVGRSEHTDKLGVRPDSLQHGAYRLVSGPDWMVFIGDDSDFVPTEPWARSNADIASGRLQREWEQITGATWGVPFGGMYKNRLRLPGETGRPGGAVVAKNETLDIWAFDERGSFNAVCDWLRTLGMRWYLPGELGEVVPSLKVIPLPAVDETVRPDFPIRRFNIRFGVVGRETALWAMRLGVRDPYGVQVAHGMDTMTGRDAIFAAHPEWFALYGGRRHYTPGSSKNQLCYSNEELFQETVRYARAQFDQYPFETVSIMPPDGYTSICQCPQCEGRDSPERDNRGLLSDYVWDFVNRVAKEVRKTHPDRKIINCAYGVYTLPPLKIETLEPNVQVCIVGGRRPSSNHPDEQAALRRLREEWAAKTDNPILIFENYPFTDRGWYLPSWFISTLGESINATKGMSSGEDIWLSVRQDFDKVGIGFNHFLVYFSARMYWGGPQQDIHQLFREYCDLFYGPAGVEMRAFFLHCEAHWREMDRDKALADTALALFATAQSRVTADSVYGRRLGLIDEFLKGLRHKSAQLGQQRGPVPKLRLVNEARQPIIVDGKLDDDAWVNCPTASSARLRELQTGRLPTFGTTVKSAWRGGSVYFAIHCEDMPGEKPNITATKKDDAALWYGDAIELLLETETHSYYQIAVNPAGAVADLDRGAPKSAWFNWDAQAEVATRVADDHWTVEIRIPVTEDENDPLHQVIGRHPRQSLPWHINICRQRIRADGQEHSALSPTGTDGFHHVMKFAHFYDGRSHEFEAAEREDDFLNAIRIASEFVRNGQRDEALAAWTKASEGKVTDLQKSHALEQAASVARSLGQFETAKQLAARIPVEAVSKTALMQTLLEQGQAASVVEQSGEEPIAEWPFWKRGDGYSVRGRAFVAVKAADRADRDFTQALRFLSDPRLRDSVSLAQAQNREHQLRDDAGALLAYQAVLEDAGQIGGSDEFHAVVGIARLQTRAGRFEEALAVLQRANPEKQRGIWRGNLLLSRMETLQAAGRKAEAIAVCEALAADPLVEERQRQVASGKVKALRE